MLQNIKANNCQVVDTTLFYRLSTVGLGIPSWAYYPRLKKCSCCLNSVIYQHVLPVGPQTELVWGYDIRARISLAQSRGFDTYFCAVSEALVAIGPGYKIQDSHNPHFYKAKK